ncbi:SMI1/KNR4 family protein [Spirillospora sp. NPDC052242]
MTTSARQLIEAARLARPATPFDWERVEHRLGAPVPQDYRELLDAGGGGLWLDYLRLHVPAPGPGFKHVDLEESGLEFEQLQELFEDEVVRPPDDLAPASRLLPWASTGTGGTLYWQVSPEAAADPYPIRASDRNGEVWERYDLLTTDLLLGIVQGEVPGELLNESWMDRDVLFKPYADE